MNSSCNSSLIYAVRTYLSRACRPAALLIAIAFPATVMGQQYQFSQGPIEQTIHGQGSITQRQHLAGIYCFDLPEKMSVRKASIGFLNNNAITWAEYPDPTNALTAFVVSSTIPESRAPDDDLKLLLATDRNSAERINDQERFSVSEGVSHWGRTIKLRMKNVAASTPDGLFPMTRGFYEDRDGPPHGSVKPTV